MVRSAMTEARFWNRGIETMPAREIAAMQLELLRHQLGGLPARSTFYRRKLAGLDLALRSLADLRRLPFTTKDELRRSQEAAPPLGEHAGVEMRDVIRVHASSGTTGRPSYVGITARDREAWTEVVSRVYACEGVGPDDVVVHGFGLGFFVGGLPLKDAVENIGATFVPIGTGATERLVAAARDLGATILTCTPSYAYYLAEWLRERGRNPRELGLRRLLLGAEPGAAIPAVRRQLADAYGALVTEGLGNADLVPVYAGTCDELAGNHLLAPDHLYLELVDPATGESLDWEDGAEGELVATHLQRECVPLVRFRVGDHVTVATSPCPCGRTGPRLVCVGRTDDMLIVAGVNVWPSAVKDVVEELRPRVTGALQIVVPDPGPRIAPPLRIEVERADGEADPPGLAAELEARLRARLIVSARVEVVAPGSLPRSEAKSRLVRVLSAERPA
jgi:phenylacetate-CoA ligase